ncbi:uncharacterized protein LOC122571556 [Bombus pyrosoma]|uniref:uncharacterized protein LOC122571556 n=1 Tax=Bombus pyrosoma TaxID=396416 RepID=UPI001CB928B3|nr:uncharacterized protein LOC122571556 [Bombus pyrosoma]
MEYNVFRDYCKAENSEDEEMNHDLQSRLYAEIYYTSNDVENVDKKSNVKLETIDTADNKLRTDANTSKVYGFNDTPRKNDAAGSCSETYIKNESGNNSTSMEDDSKPDITSICIKSTTETLSKDITNRIPNVPYVKTLKETEENIESAKNNTQLTCHNVEYGKSNSNNNTTYIVENNVKPEIKDENEEKLETVQCINNETTANQFTHPNSTKHDDDKNNEKYQRIVCNEKSNDNILKKYEFSKSFINKLYLEKYEKLKKKLQEMEEEKERSLKEKEQRKINIKENQQRQVIIEYDSHSTKSLYETETDTKYEILCRTDKLQKPINYCEEITVLTSDTESDSEESILEVPIPPKPQPPIINLQDSDENSETSSNSDTDEESSFVIRKKNNLIENVKKKDSIIDQESDSSTSVIDCTNDESATEDIMLNCTEIQKGASSIKEIIEMNKKAQSDQYNNKGKSFCEKNKSIVRNEIHTKDLTRPDMLFNNDKHNTFEFQFPLKTVNDKDVIYERDKSESDNFADDVMVSDFLNSEELTSNRNNNYFVEDVMVSNFVNSEELTTNKESHLEKDVMMSNVLHSKELTPNKKRHYDDDNEPSTSVKQRRNTDSGFKCSKENFEQHNSNDKSNRDWEEYFFRPMSEKLKAFYESQGQENFDIKEIQSKMSKDPRLWAILDEDLMPDLFKHQRYWYMKCTNCYRHGHQRHNCTEPYKPIRCHMCGAQGHTETRCPQKMCLTCGKKQGTFRKTCEACRILYCNMCNAVGHKSTECPDLWRRFHQTTRTSEINIPENLSEVMKPADLLYCCNCTKRGHDSSTCNEYRWSQHFPTPAFVSNYTSELQYEYSACENTNEDVIPLTKLKKKGVTFLPDEVDLDSSGIVYSYGTYYTKMPNGEEAKRKLLTLDIHPSHIAGLLKGRISPIFLDELTKIIKFEIKIYYNIDNELMIRVRSAIHLPQHILELFLYWLKLHDEDKLLDITISLPRRTKQLQKLLAKKLHEFEQNLVDPNYICSQIEELKTSMTTIKDLAVSFSVAKKIIDYRGDLMKVYQSKPNHTHLVKRLKRAMKHLKKISGTEVYMSHYLNIIVLYNKIFVPRRLTDIELKRFLARYYKTSVKTKDGKKNEAKKLKKNEAKKLKKNKLTPYEELIGSLREYNKKENTINKSDACSSKDIEAQTIQIPSFVSIEHIPTNNIIQSNDQDVTCNAKNVFTETHTAEKNVTKFTDDTAQSSHNQDISSNQMTDPIQNSNVVTIPFQKSTHNNVSSRTTKNVPCAKIKPSGNNKEKHSGTENSNNKEAKTNNLQEQNNIINSEISVTKKKKSKKAKKAKLDLENSLEIIENQEIGTDTFLENKASEIINEALEFNLPYMNKAVGEIRKRINDKNLKQEHIDTLLRLINLEKDHRKYVSSFYNYLQ